MSNVILKGVSKFHGHTEILRGVDLTVDDGEFVVFVGPSGCGKTTLLRLIAGLESVSAGSVYIGDRLVNDVLPSQRGVAMVFQSYALYPHMTVRENISFGLRLGKADAASIDRAVAQAAAVLQLSHLLERKPKELSGGQRQRVAIGRAIVRNPQAFLFDEPLSNLDAGLRIHMRVEIARLHRDLGKTMIYVTHDQMEAMTLADRIVVLNTGRVEQVGTPLELYHAPRNQFVAGFIGSPRMNFLEGRPGGAGCVRLVSGEAMHVAADTSALASDERLTLGIRPEHVCIAAPGEDNTVQGTVTLVEHLGDTSYLHVELPQYALPLMMRVTSDARQRAGDVVMLRFPRSHCYVFDAHGKTISLAQGTS
jgi:multiple sugar transport system ATP-binding protein